MEEIECPHCHGTGKVTLKKDDIINSHSGDVISVPLGWFEEYEELQRRLTYHVYILKTIMRPSVE